jgi:hypothetical protein
MANDSEGEARECAYLGGIIIDGSLEAAPRIDVPKGAILTFLQEILVKNVCDEMLASGANSFTMMNMCTNIEMQNLRLMDKSRFGISSPGTLQSGSPTTAATSSRKESESLRSRPRKLVGNEAFRARRESWGIRECEAILTCYGQILTEKGKEHRRASTADCDPLSQVRKNVTEITRDSFFQNHDPSTSDFPTRIQSPTETLSLHEIDYIRDRSMKENCHSLCS